MRPTAEGRRSLHASRAQSLTVEPGDARAHDAVVLRAAVEHDLPSLGALATQVFFDTYATGGIRPALVREAERHVSAHALRDRLQVAGVRITVAERAGHLVAFSELAVDACHALLPLAPAAELVRLYVQRPFGRRGLGTRLLRHAEAEAAASGAAMLWLTAWSGNAPALAFYGRRGYVPLGSTPYVFEGEQHENQLFAKTLRSTEPPFAR